MAHLDWVLMGFQRLPNILRVVRYASIRQLESKISEAGPPHMRPSPIHLREALNARVRRREIIIQPKPPNPVGLTLPDFYTLPDFSLDSSPDAARRAQVLALYETFFRAGNEDRGKTLERAVFRAAQEARAAGRWVMVIGSPDRPPEVGLVINGVAIEEAPDLILVGKDGTAIVEDKNGREWMTPWSHEVWELIAKALRHDALPVLVCRKVTYPLFLLFKEIGALAFQMHGQVFHADFAERLARVKHREGLGFADIRFGDQPPPTHTKTADEARSPCFAALAWGYVFMRRGAPVPALVPTQANAGRRTLEQPETTRPTVPMQLARHRASFCVGPFALSPLRVMLDGPAVHS